MSKITFRVDDEVDRWLEDYVEENDYSKSDVMRSHLESMKEDELYREFHEYQIDEGQSLKKFVESRSEFDSKWVNLEEVDYEEMFSRFKGIVQTAERGEFDEAYKMVDSLAEEGYEREEILLNSVVSEFER